MKNTTSIQKAFRKFIVIPATTALIMLACVSFSFAGPGGADKVKSHLTTKVKRMVANAEVDQAASLSGDAVIFFHMDQEGKIKVKGIFGTNEDLIEHIEDTLEGAEVNIAGLSPDEEYTIRMKYVDLR